ncbi:MAG: hypothetical protein AAGF32_05920 [Pseudomonadota bacterium]
MAYADRVDRAERSAPLRPDKKANFIRHFFARWFGLPADLAITIAQPNRASGPVAHARKVALRSSEHGPKRKSLQMRAPKNMPKTAPWAVVAHMMLTARYSERLKMVHAPGWITIIDHAARKNGRFAVRQHSDMLYS